MKNFMMYGGAIAMVVGAIYGAFMPVFMPLMWIGLGAGLIGCFVN